VVRRGEQGVGRGLLDDLAGVHHEHAPRDLGHHAQVVRDEHERGAEPALHVGEQREHLRLDGHVERGGGLVGDDHGGVHHERHGDHHALAHAARELVRVLGGAARGVGDAHGLEHLDGAAHAARRDSPSCTRGTSAIWSPTVNTGLRAVIGSWKIIATRAPRRAQLALGRVIRSRPSNSTWLPGSISPGGRIRRRIESAVTDLPQPLSPTTPRVSPAWTSNDTPSTERRCRRRCGSTCGGRGPGGRGRRARV
jgi:hypothetical protein